MLYTKTLRINYVICTLLSLIVLSMLIVNIRNSKFVYDYNKNLETSLSKYLSQRSTALIILIVSGDKYYLTPNLKSLFTENQILHLLVLSGGNLVILIHFLGVFIYRNSLSYFVFKYLFLIEYFVFTQLQHPLARAIIFILLNDIYNLWGFRYQLKYKYLMLLSASSVFILLFGFSLSFSLSLYFALAISIYSDFIKPFLVISRFVNFFVYSIYVTLVTTPLILVFKDTNILRSLFSNFLIVPIFELIIPICYFVYFLGPFVEFIGDSFTILSAFELVFSALFGYLDYVTITL